MRQIRHYVSRSGLALAWGLLIGCASDPLPPATPATSAPTNPAASETAVALPYPAPLQTTNNAAYPAGSSTTPPSPYPEPASAPQQPTEQLLQGTLSVLFPAPVLGVVIDGDMRVLDIEAASAAATAGVQVGDQLATLDGIPLDSQIQSVKEYIGTARADQAMRLVVRRGADTIELTVMPFSPHPPRDPRLQPGQIVPTTTPVLPPNDYL